MRGGSYECFYEKWYVLFSTKTPHTNLLCCGQGARQLPAHDLVPTLCGQMMNTFFFGADCCWNQNLHLRHVLNDGPSFLKRHNWGNRFGACRGHWKVATAADLAELLYFNCSFGEFLLLPIHDRRFETVTSEIFVASCFFGCEPLNGLAPAFISKTLHDNNPEVNSKRRDRWQLQVFSFSLTSSVGVIYQFIHFLSADGCRKLWRITCRIDGLTVLHGMLMNAKLRI